jgi:PEP-CTERM motif
VPTTPPGFSSWQLDAPTSDARSASVAVLISNLSRAATINSTILTHFTTPIQIEPIQIDMPNPEFGGQGSPIIFGAAVSYPGAGSAPVQSDNVIGNEFVGPGGTAPEPSTLVMGVVGLAGVALVRRWRAKARS